MADGPERDEIVASCIRWARWRHALQTRSGQVRGFALYRMAGLEVGIEVTLSWLVEVTMRV
jgi:hypothetical protein